MKIAGIVMISIGILGIILPIIALIASGEDPRAEEMVAQSLAGGTIWIVIGGLLVHSAKKDKKKKNKKINGINNMTEEEKQIIESTDVSFWHCPKCNSNDVRMRYYEKSFAKELVGWTVFGVLGSLLSLRGTGWYVFCNNCGNKFTTKEAEEQKKKTEEQTK